MKTNDNRNSSEAGSLSLSGWRRDSARRLSLRQAGLSLGRAPSPWWQRKYAQLVDQGE
jgi:hypothetical protein